MSSPATALFLSLWRNRVTRVPRTLAKVEVANPSPVTFYVASAETVLPDGSLWEAGLRCDPLRWKIQRLGTGLEPASCAIHLADRLYPFMSSGTLVGTLSSMQWQGAVVTLYLWNDVRDSSGAQRLGMVDLFRVFKGTVDSFDYDNTSLNLGLLQDRSWKKPVPPNSVDRITYPNAPDGTQGMAVPILYGDFSAFPMRPPHTTAFGNKTKQEDVGGGQGVVPLLLVDPGTGSANVKLLAAGHKCVEVFDRSIGCSLFVAAGDVLAPLDASGVTKTLGVAESYVSIADDSLIAYYGIRPTDVRAASNTATNPRRAGDVFDETSFATLDQSTGKNLLQLQIPGISDLGFIEAVEASLCFSGNGSNTQNIQIYPYDTAPGASPAAGSKVNTASTPTTPQILTGTWDSNFWNRPWRFAENTLHTGPIDIRVDFAGAVASNKASIYWVAIKVKFRPQRNLMTPEFVKPGGLSFDKFAPRPFRKKINPAIVVQPAQYEVSSQFFGNPKGYQDDSSGTYAGDFVWIDHGICSTSPAPTMINFSGPYNRQLTKIAPGDVVLDNGGGNAFFDPGTTFTSVDPSTGTCLMSANCKTNSIGQNVKLKVMRVGRLIQKPPDIARHFLATYGGASAFETGAAAFGSFNAARYELRNGSPNDYVLACRIADRSNAAQVLQKMLEQSLCAVTQDWFTGNWLFHVWKRGAPVNYDRIFDRDDVADLFRAGVATDVDMVQGLRIGYGFDGYKGRTLFESFVTATGSSQGYNLPTQRDQVLTIVAGVNDGLDWNVPTPATFYDTIAAGTYAPIDLADQIQQKIRARMNPGYWSVGFGFTIKAGYNDNASFKIGATTYVGTLRAGDYAADELAVEVARAMAAAYPAATFTCTYAQDTNTFTLSASVAFSIIMLTVAPSLTTCWWALGFNTDYTGFTTYVASNPTYADRFYVRCVTSASFNLLFSSGAHVASSIAPVIGFPKLDTLTVNAVFAAYARGQREAICAASQGQHGSREDESITADWIRDESTAQQYRDRMFDIGNVPPTWVKFRTHACPDMQGMRVIGFDASCDARRPFPGYGSDGSWAGKSMRALEIAMDLESSYHTEIYAEEA